MGRVISITTNTWAFRRFLELKTKVKYKHTSWWLKFCITWCSRYPSIHRVYIVVLYIPGGKTRRISEASTGISLKGGWIFHIKSVRPMTCFPNTIPMTDPVGTRTYIYLHFHGWFLWFSCRLIYNRPYRILYGIHTLLPTFIFPRQHFFKIWRGQPATTNHASLRKSLRVEQMVPQKSEAEKLAQESKQPKTHVVKVKSRPSFFWNSLHCH